MLGTLRLVLESGVNKHGAEELSSFCFHTLTCKQRQPYTLKPSETRAHAFIGLIDGRNHLLVTHDVVHVHARPFRGANEQQTDSGCHFLLCGNTDTAQTHRLFPVFFFMAPENTPGEVGGVFMSRTTGVHSPSVIPGTAFLNESHPDRHRQQTTREAGAAGKGGGIFVRSLQGQASISEVL